MTTPPYGTSSIATHLVVTPARNEAENLKRLGACLIEQVWRPTKWIVVDNGSTDETGNVVQELAEGHPWITLVSIPPADRPIRGSASVRAFNAGIAGEGLRCDLITNLDADVSFPPTYFQSLRGEFEARPSLGIASGLCFELANDDWKPVYVTYPNLRGAARTYRRECLKQLVPLEERFGWDGIDAVRANVRRWETGTIPSLAYFHHRPTGSLDVNRFATYCEEGVTSYYMWYRPSYLIIRTTYRIIRDRSLAPGGLLWGYARSAATRGLRQPEVGFRQFVRSNQSLRHWLARAREALGRNAESSAAALSGQPVIGHDQSDAQQR